MPPNIYSSVFKHHGVVIRQLLRRHDPLGGSLGIMRVTCICELSHVCLNKSLLDAARSLNKSIPGCKK